MKKVIFLLSFLVAFFVSNAQYPVVQFLGRDSVLVDSRGGFKARLINYPFTDTTEANTQRISQYAGAFIYTTSGGDKLWLRNSTATAWSRVGAGGSGSGIASLGLSDYGLTIQNDSTYKVDTSKLSTKLWRQKGIDSVQANVNLKLNITDTANMRVRLYAGSNVTITGTYPNLTIASSGGGGGSQDLQSVTDLGDSTTNRIVTNDSLKSMDALVHAQVVVGDSVGSGKIAVWYGDSQSTGGGCFLVQYAYPKLTGDIFGWYTYNRAISGTRMTQTVAGDSSMIERLFTIPTYTSDYSWISFMYGANDRHILGFDTVTYKNSYSRVIDTCIARGWPLNRINVISPAYADPVVDYCPGLNHYATACRTIAESKGVNFYDAYNYMAVRGGNDLACGDSLHPSRHGAVVIANLIQKQNTLDNKVGFVNVKGGGLFEDSLNAKTLRIGGFTPSQGTISTAIGGNTVVSGFLRIGDLLADLDNAKLQVRASANQVGVSVWNGVNNYNRMYPEFTQISDASSTTKFYPNYINYNNGFTFTGSGGNTNILSLGTYGGIVMNEVGLAADTRIEGDNQTHLFYVNGTNDRIGIRTSTPDSVFTVNGSVHFMSTFRHSGAPVSSDTTTYKPYGISSTGATVRMTSWPVGAGGGTTYKIGTYNSQTGSVNGAVIVSDSIYMQAFTAENPGLVPAGGSGSTYLKGDGTWGTISGGTGYVDSVSNNAGGDSLIVVKGATRYAYVYPAGSTGWSLSGNSTTGGWTEGNFLGTTNNRQLLIRTNNIMRARIDSAGAAGIFRLYPGTATTAHIDYGTTANSWNITAQSVYLTGTTAAYIVTNGVNTAAFYNGDMSISNSSVPGTTKLLISNASTTKSAINLSGTTLKITPIAGDIDRDHSYLYVTLGSALRQKIATDIDTITFTNKRITPRVATTASSSSLTINSDNSERYTVTALAADMTINNPSGTPTDGQTLLIRIKDDGTARALTWSGSQFRVIGVTLPTTTVISKTVYIGLIWNSADSKWDVVSVNQEA